jgi:hypothetical protein
MQVRWCFLEESFLLVERPTSMFGKPAKIVAHHVQKKTTRW